MRLDQLLILLTLFGTGTVHGQSQYPPEIESDTVLVYKRAGDADLKLWVFNPFSHSKKMPKPAIVFFFGGGWNGGTPLQFFEHAKYLSSRGMVAILADYRVKSRNKTQAIYALKDAKSAIRWVRKHSREMGIDPDKIVSGGGSAGGHLAAAVGTIPFFDEENEDKNISSKPNAMVLFNPVVMISPVSEFKDSEKLAKYTQERIGVPADKFSPYNYIDKNTPPAVIFHGDKDSAVDFNTVMLFNSKMKKSGNDCTLYLYKDEAHGFFNYSKNHLNSAYSDTVQKMDEFLVSLGYLKPLPGAMKY